MRGEARFIELIKIDHKKRDLDKSKNKRRLWLFTQLASWYQTNIVFNEFTKIK